MGISPVSTSKILPDIEIKEVGAGHGGVQLVPERKNKVCGRESPAQEYPA